MRCWSFKQSVQRMAEENFVIILNHLRVLDRFEGIFIITLLSKLIRSMTATKKTGRVQIDSKFLFDYIFLYLPDRI